MDNLPTDIIKLILEYDNDSLFYINKRCYSLISKRIIKFTKDIKKNNSLEREGSRLASRAKLVGIKEISAFLLVKYTLKLKNSLLELNLENCNLNNNSLIYVSKLKNLEILNISKCGKLSYNNLSLLYNLNNLKVLIISTDFFPKRLIEIFKCRWKNKYNLKILINNTKL